jgi:hypothetical protein
MPTLRHLHQTKFSTKLKGKSFEIPHYAYLNRCAPLKEQANAQSKEC